MVSFKNPKDIYMLKKPNKELRKRLHTDYNDTTVFSSWARLLQSVWRRENGYSYVKYGNFLELDFAKKYGANFLTKNIFEIVKNEVSTKNKSGKVIKEPRIWNNLLSSQPLAFNLFGELISKRDGAAKVFQTLYPERNISLVTDIKFEHSPGRGDLKYTGDKSAFDVFVEYSTTNNEKGFLGIEVKYAEDLNDEPSSHKATYERISELSKIFDMSKLEELKGKPVQQIWRDHLLALSLFITNDDYDIGDFIYLYPKGNKNCGDGIKQYRKIFTDSKEHYFQPLTMERLVEVMKTIFNSEWLQEFEDRYLNFGKLDLDWIDNAYEERKMIIKSDPFLFKQVSDILFKHDPIGINYDINTDEYEPEAGTIIQRLRKCSSSIEARKVIYEEFLRWFYNDVGNEIEYTEIAKEIWSVWITYNSKKVDIE